MDGALRWFDAEGLGFDEDCIEGVEGREEKGLVPRNRDLKRWTLDTESL